ncbi:MAG: hypothetical protein RLZZ589_639, partial [Cyanobacteriota bacterium]
MAASAPRFDAVGRFLLRGLRIGA